MADCECGKLRQALAPRANRGPLPGDIGLVHMAGETGRLIRLGQELNGDGFADYEHAVIAVGFEQKVHHGTRMTMVKCVGAMPSGAKIQYFAPGEALWSYFCLTCDQRQRIAEAAEGYIGTPYSFADYFAIAAHRLHVPAPGLKAYIRSSKHMICSQLADQCYQDAGLRLFNDNRWAGYVTPGSLYQLIKSSGSGWIPYAQPAHT